ncbi:hypothetical protein ACDQ58_02965 [Fusobacterium animalis]|uniref:hypothetical protein n=1 Tax=Fusobacterium animalis TaxID=76859 RepID=UPI003556E251
MSTISILSIFSNNFSKKSLTTSTERGEYLLQKINPEKIEALKKLPYKLELETKVEEKENSWAKKVEKSKDKGLER